jgi:DNA-binding GntR family transcriptional regulator
MPASPAPRKAARKHHPANAKRAGTAPSSLSSTIDDISDRVLQAIREHRLPPGTKLGEDRMAGIFGVSRARIREVFNSLAVDGIVELVPQRGAHVARPSPEQARDVFELRRLIEPGVVRRLVSTLTPERLARLREHHQREIDARRRKDTRAVIRLSGEFHLLLAELSGNHVFYRTMRELTTLTCLAIFLYDAPTAQTCRADEHAALIDAISKADATTATKLMIQHLIQIEANLDLSAAGVEVDLEAVFNQTP